MRHEQIDDDLSRLAFDFFFWFSKFESALKESRYLDPDEIGAPARPNWNRFIKDYRSQYKPSQAALALLEAKPKRQIVGEHELEFADVKFAPATKQLDRVVTLAKIVRNNLFHGGKHGSAYWDNPDRMRALLRTTITVLGELAHLGGFEADYTGYY